MAKTYGNIDLKPGDHVTKLQILSEEDRVYWENCYARVLSGEQFTVILHRDTPHEYWSEVSFHPISEDGMVIGAACYSRDITERKISEMLILQNQQMLEDAESIAHFGSWECDLQSSDNLSENDLRWSNEVFRIFGYEPGEIEVSNDNFFKTVFPEDRDLIKIAVQKAIEESTSYSYDHRIIRPDGEVRWVHEEAKIILNPQTGKPVKMIGTVLDITERKAAEAKLLDAERNYREIFDKASEGIFVHEVETGRVVDANLMACEITGATKEEIINGTQQEFLSGVAGYGLEDAANYMLKAIKEGPQLFEWYSKRKDGTLYWNEVSLTLATIAGVQRILAFFRKIDDRKLAEETLHLSNERYELVTKATNDAIWDWNLLTDEVYWSEGYEKMFGYKKTKDGSSDEIWAKRIHPDDTIRVWTSVKEAIHNPNSHSWQNEYRYIKADGTVAYVHDRGYIIYNEAGHPTRMVGAMQDITSHKLAEDSLQKSEANLRTIFDHADRAYILLDKEYRILSYNSVANEIAKLFYNKEFEEGKSLLTYLKGGLPEDREQVLNRVLNGEVMDHEVEVKMADGGVRWFRVRRYPVRNENGDILGICIATKDSTMRKNFEIERDKMMAEIVQRNKDLEQFAYIVSHNLRAPVANIIGFSDALLQMELDETERYDMLEGLGISIKRLDSTILDLNKILQVKKSIELARENVSFSELVKDIKLSICAEFEKEKAVIHEDFTQVDEMLTHKSYLHSIFYNLISNSLKYRRQDVFPVIKIESRRIENKIELSFSDNGLGIDIEKKNDLIFGLYKRFHPAVAEGKGMGLFMVKMQVENLGGKITVNSNVNAGTEFRIVFDC